MCEFVGAVVCEFVVLLRSSRTAGLSLPCGRTVRRELRNVPRSFSSRRTGVDVRRVFDKILCYCVGARVCRVGTSEDIFCSFSDIFY